MEGRPFKPPRCGIRQLKQYYLTFCRTPKPASILHAARYHPALLLVSMAEAQTPAWAVWQPDEETLLGPRLQSRHHGHINRKFYGFTPTSIFRIWLENDSVIHKYDSGTWSLGTEHLPRASDSMQAYFWADEVPLQQVSLTIASSPSC
jgi:hypothetical protein